LQLKKRRKIKMKKTISLLTALTFALGFSIVTDAKHEEATGVVSAAWVPGEGGGGGD
jgi:hypothetical protein